MIGEEEFERVGLEGRLFLVYKALYGLKSFGKQFNEHLEACHS